jgi:hypothetical protein
MDDVEKRVEKLREQAIAMEQEKDPIFQPFISSSRLTTTIHSPRYGTVHVNVVICVVVFGLLNESESVQVFIVCLYIHVCIGAGYPIVERVGLGSHELV